MTEPSHMDQNVKETAGDGPENDADGQRGSGATGAGTESSSSEHTPWSSMIYRLCEELIAMRETNHRQHKMFEHTLLQTRETLQDQFNQTRETLQDRFNTFAAETQRAYQQLRDELNAEKRLGLAVLQELLDLGADLDGLVASRPPAGDAETMARWAESVAVEARKAQAALARHGIHPYDAVIGAVYNPALHERIGSQRKPDVEPDRILEQRERGYASERPEFVLRRPKVIISE